MAAAEPSGNPPAFERGGVLDMIERIGNKLPEPAILFAILAAIVVFFSAFGAWMGWQVQPVKLSYEMVPQVDASGQGVMGADGKALLVPKVGADGEKIRMLEPMGQPLKPRSLLTGEGIYWMFSSMLRNFTSMPALGLIFVAMLGIGLAEKFGFFGALMRALALATPKSILTPVIVLIGANSSVASDAGYIILPPLAAALYLAVGRHPIAGLAAAFAGVAGGFGGGFFPTGGDGVLAGFAQDAARVIDQTYSVGILHNLYFKAGSAIVVMLAGWLVTDWIVEPRLNRGKAAELAGVGGAGGASDEAAVIQSMALTAMEKKGLTYALATNVVVLGMFGLLILVPGAPLNGIGAPTLANGRVVAQQPVVISPGSAIATTPAEKILFKSEPVMNAAGEVTDPGLVVAMTGAKPTLLESPGDRWSHVIVPIIFLAFLVPGMAYGVVTGTLRSQKDFIEGLYHGIRSIVPVLAIAFFMAQFVNYFAYSGLDRMLAYAGGSLLVQADIPIPLLLVAFVFLVVLGDFAISGMLSKFGVLAPIFIPMFMMVGKSPELTTAAYRIGDSVVNIITPLNSYLLIILAVLQRYKKDAGLGSLISLMLPYSVVFFLIWTGFLLVWYYSGWPLGPDAPLHYGPKVG